MKKTIFKPGSKLFIIGLVGLLALGSCRKSDKIAEVSPKEFVGDWKLSDLMLVNAGDKPPRKLEELPRLNDLRFIMAPDGRLSAGGNEKGTWAVAKDMISFRFDGEEPLDLKVSRLEPGFMVLEYGFDANDGSHGGTIYYAFAK
ncbi:hypothetical protein [Flavitalea sp.]|nr:hypothetical protein [Flavitalea sp.]